MSEEKSAHGPFYCALIISEALALTQEAPFPHVVNIVMIPHNII